MKSKTECTITMVFTFLFPLTQEQARKYDRIRLNSFMEVVKAEMDYRLTREIKDMLKEIKGKEK